MASKSDLRTFQWENQPTSAKKVFDKKSRNLQQSAVSCIILSIPALSREIISSICCRSTEVFPLLQRVNPVK